MDFKALTSLTAMFFQQAERMADQPFLWRKQDKEWRPLSWGEVSKTVVQLAHGLRALGVKNGDRVLLVSENRPEWLMADLAIMAAGAITVPAYTTNTVADHLHLLNNSGARIAIVSTRALAERLLAAALQANRQPLVVAIEPLGFSQSPGIEMRQWQDLLALGAARDVAAPPVSPARGDTACVIYTSGTGGAPKGVMLSHGAIISNCMGAYHLLEEIGLEDEVFLSFLPLSHSYEHTAGQFFPIAIGAQIYYAEGIEMLGANMAEVHPTIMTAVPRLYEMMRSRILKGMDKNGGLKARLFRLALDLGGRRVEGQLGFFAGLLDRLLDVLVRRKVAERFGGRLKAMVSGGAPLNYDVGLFFTALGVRILQGYGQTESAPLISCNPPRRVKLRCVGPAVAGVEARIAEDGEICVRGELVMQGYWNDPEATAAVIKDGWLHTGDIGLIDEDGYIRITDRKKDILVNSGGDNISPQRIEGFLTLRHEVAQAMVYGDRRPHLVALLVPDAENAAAWAQTHGKPSDLEQLVADGEFRRHMGQAVDRVNQTLSPIEKVRKFILTAETFTVDNEMCTPTLKIRRHVINAHYGAALDSLYDERKA
ncbi:MAG TPA: AMP-binding protein [Candidatus Sulfotelmatobacter sp.]|jgi:long-chain acyl-CoA synthetase|nr:AMP-binding protein [Candidatus Sulfotelmatobacter sp.]